MKKLFIVFACLVSVLLTSCGAVNVSGKKYQYQVEGYPLTVEFAADSDKVFYMTDVGTYQTVGSDIVVNYNGREIRLTAKGDSLYLYQFDKDGNQTAALNKEIVFKQSGVSDYFTNTLAGKTDFSEKNIRIEFTETEANVGGNKLSYSFDKNTGKYAIEGYEPTSDKKEFKENIVSAILNNILGSSDLPLTYEKGWWFRQRISDKVDDKMVKKYVASFYSEDYSATKGDDFERNKLLKEKKEEFTEKYWAVDTKETFKIVQPASLGKYDFNNGEFKISTDLFLKDIKSTFAGDACPLEVRLGSYSRNNVTWYSGISTEVTFKIPEDKAEELSKEAPACLIVYTVQPIMQMDWNTRSGELSYDKWGDGYQSKYIQYYSVKSAELIRKDTMTPMGEVFLKSTW